MAVMPPPDPPHRRRRPRGFSVAGPRPAPAVRRGLPHPPGRVGPTALEALKELKLRDEKVGLLLADHRMPEMTGVEFLEQARQFYPKARRVLLTAYADTDAAIAAINQADVHYYLLKPWDPPKEKLYPVLDDLLEDWKMQDRLKSDERTPGRRPPVVGSFARGQGLPDPQPGAVQVARART